MKLALIIIGLVVLGTLLAGCETQQTTAPTVPQHRTTVQQPNGTGISDTFESDTTVEPPQVPP
jgi:hypothetical protein